MNWGLAQGLIGRARGALAPSTAALGPNSYLSERDFLKMLGIAFVLHALAFGVSALVPRETVTDIPVRALSFKLGGTDQVAAYNPTPSSTPAAPVMQAVSKDSWKATPNLPSPAIPSPLKPVAKIQPVAKYVPVKPKTVRIDDALAQQKQEAPPVVAPTPQQYVREVGAPSPQVVAAVTGNAAGAIGGAGNDTSMSAQTAEAVRARYEQEISGWIQQHKLYPSSANGREGRVVVRMRIDRTGAVRYYAIEQTSGVQALDDAALDMVRRANPVPAVPANYPAANLVEFLIPISFKAPQ